MLIHAAAKYTFTTNLAMTGIGLPGENASAEPGEHRDDHSTALGANVSGLQRSTDGVVALKTDGQYSENRRMRCDQLHKCHHQTCSHIYNRSN